MSAWTSPQLPPGFRSKAKAESPRLRNLSWFRLVWMELKAFVENNIGFHLVSTPTCFVECFGGCLGPKTFKKNKKNADSRNGLHTEMVRISVRIFTALYG